jgi:hypothetical protein
MPRKTSISIDLSVIVPILVGIIVLMGVYIIVNNQKKVTFADPVVSQEIVIPDYYMDVPIVRNEPIFLQQPTYFNPNLGHNQGQTNMYNIQMKEPFSMSEFVSGILPEMKSQMPSPSSMSPSSNVTSMMPSITPSSNVTSMMPSMSSSSNVTSMMPSMKNIPEPSPLANDSFGELP